MKITFKCLTDGYFDHVLPDEVRVARFREALRKRMQDVATFWQGESKKNAPIGPTKEQLRTLHKKGSYETGGTRAKPPTTIHLTRFYRMSAAALSSSKRGTVAGPVGGLKERLSSWKSPGGLVRSIEAKGDENGVEVFVASNGEASEYAHIIHDLKGVKWHERGPGTQAKGDRADEKFIERAQPDAEKRMDEYLSRSLKELFGS